MMKKTAHCIHHTHWDLIWYFTKQDAMVQFAYNMKEMLKGFKEGTIENFFLDGQSVPVDEYLMLHPEDENQIKQLIKDKKLFIGPFHSQLDCFISSGESIVNNLRLGMKKAKELGYISKIAYLPDSFGHSYDFPKIFNSYGIFDFVITRGVGDNYDLDSEFYMESNDGSKILVCTMIAGYGYGCYPFKEGRLFDTSAEDYNKISVHSLIERLLKYSTLPNEFVFPLGFDQNPAMLHIPERIKAYNEMQQDIEFKMTTWEDFCHRVREKGQQLKVHKHELFSTQYHRLHKSIFSARSDVKALQDQCERVLTYELQPMMSMLDACGIEYDHGLIDEAWNTLLKCQTHSSANLTDETNDYIERETKNALQLALSTKVYLMKIVSISLDEKEIDNPLVVFHTLPNTQKMISKCTILTKTPYFKIMDNEQEVPFTVIESTRKNCGVLRKDVQLIDRNKFYYETQIYLETTSFEGIGYKAYQIVEEDYACMKVLQKGRRFIENENYQVYLEETGVTVYNKKTNTLHRKALYIEESGDEGDSFDYSYPTFDYVYIDDLSDADALFYICDEVQWMVLKGVMKVPADLTSRKHKRCDELMPYEISIILKKDSLLIELEGKIDNRSKQHRVRIVFSGMNENEYSYAGTQYGLIKRETMPKELETWKEDGWFEEPSPTFPLLNHVSLKGKEGISVYTKSSKEYECINDGCKDLAITLFRSYGAMGYPDLHRRPGRPSGLDYMVFETPKCQMLKENMFALAFSYHDEVCANQIANQYVEYATDMNYYQKQDFDKSLNAIAYFPTNPLEKKLPIEYQFIALKNSNITFGSIVKSDIGDHYLMRLYNNEETEVNGGYLCVKDYDIAISDLAESKVEPATCELGAFSSGELRILRLNKK